MSQRRAWALERVQSDVYCDSHGHYHFFALFTVRGRRVKVEFFPDGWCADRAMPKYAMQAICDHIGFKGPDAFSIYEKYQDGSERRNEYRYHDPERFAEFVRGLYPLPF